MPYRTLYRVGFSLVLVVLLLGAAPACWAAPLTPAAQQAGPASLVLGTSRGALAPAPLPVGDAPGPAWRLTLYMLLVIVVAGVMLGLSYVLGSRHRAPATGEPYESGMPPTGSARLRISAQFYLVAIFFVLFDLEAVFIVSWAIAFRGLGWAGYFEVLVFIGVLLAALVYLWRVGALDWRTRKHQGSPARSDADDGDSC